MSSQDEQQYIQIDGSVPEASYLDYLYLNSTPHVTFYPENDKGIAAYLSEVKTSGKLDLCSVHNALERHLPEHHLLTLVKRYMAILKSHIVAVRDFFPQYLGHESTLASTWLIDTQTTVVYTMLQALCLLTDEDSADYQIAAASLGILAKSIDTERTVYEHFDNKLATLTHSRNRKWLCS